MRISAYALATNPKYANSFKWQALAGQAGKTFFEYHVTTPEGIEHVFTNLSEFCDLNNLSKSHLGNMFNKGTFYKGWTGYKINFNDCKEDIELVISEGALKGGKYEYHLFDRDNKEYVFRNMDMFCKDNKIGESTLSKLLKREIEYRGWKIYRNDL